uniref:Oncostatin M n=1 Tax=Jaculus jaculus TaxID=51337 RepID=A0A8C5L117_JACJA
MVLLLASAAAAMRGCSRSYAQLLSQLQNQANMEENPNLLLEPYIHLQDLDTDILRNSCMVYPSVFPSEDALRALSKPGFLRAVHATLGRLWNSLTALQKQLLQDQDLPRLTITKHNIQGMRNNIHCLAWWLGSPLETSEPTQGGSRVSLTPTPALDVFWSKMKSCRLLWGYHHFIGLVGRVFREWEDNPNRSRRHSPLRLVLPKGTRKIRPSRRGQRPVRRAQ